MTKLRAFGVAVWTVVVLTLGFILGYERGFGDAYEFSTRKPLVHRGTESTEE